MRGAASSQSRRSAARSPLTAEAVGGELRATPSSPTCTVDLDMVAGGEGVKRPKSRKTSVHESVKRERISWSSSGTSFTRAGVSDVAALLPEATRVFSPSVLAMCAARVAVSASRRPAYPSFWRISVTAVVVSSREWPVSRNRVPTFAPEVRVTGASGRSGVP